MDLVTPCCAAPFFILPSRDDLENEVYLVFCAGVRCMRSWSETGLDSTPAEG